ncbi:MAG: histidinol dehydrogenase [Candidatus Hadarchaeaceae archaeon]
MLKIVRLWECSQGEREKLLKRSELDVSSALPKVTKIVADVRELGDKALLEYTRSLDGVKLDQKQLRVSEREINAAYKQVDVETVKAIKRAAAAIEKFHRRQLPREWSAELRPGIRVGQLVRPLARVGIYIPGGLASYPSSALMAAIPARIAGVGQIIACTPPKKDGGVNGVMLVAADVAGIDVVFKVGGAQAIAAMAYGTTTIPKVDKIVGPGNIYVVAAKQVVAPNVDVDFAAGPSEVLIIADATANPKYVAADMLAQAEHDPAAAAVLVTTSPELASEVCETLKKILENPRVAIARRALSKYGRVIVTANLGQAIEFANDYAPEHLELMVKRPKQALKRVRNAAAIFIGPYSPVAAGDFAVGPNHILPTGGEAKRRSGLSVLDFVRLPTLQALTERGLKCVAATAERLAKAEGLPGHAQSIKKRLKEE